jgi:hypothetical protein
MGKKNSHVYKNKFFHDIHQTEYLRQFDQITKPHPIQGRKLGGPS